jgi:hypothetical protein
LDATIAWYWISSIFLAIILFKPVKKLIFVKRVRKAERKLKRDLTEEERDDLEKRTKPIAALLVLTFSLLFNSVLMGKYHK